MSFAILRTAKLKTIGNIAGSLHHTFRSIKTENADPERTHLNINSHKNTEQALNAIKDRLPQKIRKNGVLAIEYLITGSPEWDGWGTDKQNEFFSKSLEWLKEKHGAENVVTTSIQLDETTPHLVAYVVPIDRKGKLNCREFLGGRDKLQKMQTDFANKVGIPLGLERGKTGSKAEHNTIKHFYDEVKELFSGKVDLPEIDKGVFGFGGDTVKTYKEKAEKAVVSKIKIAKKETEKEKGKYEKLNNELEKLKKQAKPYFDCLDKLGYGQFSEFNERISYLADDMRKEYDRQQQAELEKQKELEKQEKLKKQKEIQDMIDKAGVNKLAKFGSCYRGKIINIIDIGIVQQVGSDLVLHTQVNPINIRVGCNYEIDYRDTERTGQYEFKNLDLEQKEDKKQKTANKNVGMER